jgi:hypothetical protein
MRLPRKEQAQAFLRDTFFFVPVLLNHTQSISSIQRHHHGSGLRLRAVVALAAWAAGILSLFLHFVVGSSIYGWLWVCAFQLFFVVAGSVCVYNFVEYREKAVDAMAVALSVNPLLEVSIGIRALQVAQSLWLGAVWTSLMFILPGLVFDLRRRATGEYYVDVTTLWKTITHLDDACKVRLAVDSVLFVWLLALFFIQLLQRLLS